MINNLKVSAAPHLKARNMTVSAIMWQVVLAMVPAMLAAIFFFGIRSLALTAYAVVAAVLTEYIIQKLRGVPVTISDGSAVVTGILLAFNINVASPWWLPVIGSVFAIAIGKQVFGGLGHNLFNPALLGRAFLLASWPSLVTAHWTKTQPAFSMMFKSINGLNLSSLQNVPEAITSATPLAAVKSVRVLAETNPDLAQQVMDRMASLDTISQLFIGNIGGVIGEVSALALLIGAAYMAFRYIISWRIPMSYILTVFFTDLCLWRTGWIVLSKYIITILSYIFRWFNIGSILYGNGYGDISSYEKRDADIWNRSGSINGSYPSLGRLSRRSILFDITNELLRATDR